MFFFREEYEGQARIRDGAIVGQDHHWARWEDDPLDPVFDVYSFLPTEKVLIADGYGNLKKPNAYGSGCLYVKNEDLVWIHVDELLLPNAR